MVGAPGYLGLREGDTSIDETMAQYTALMVMKHHFGAEKMKKFLRFELDQYLARTRPGTQ